MSGTSAVSVRLTTRVAPCAFVTSEEVQEHLHLLKAPVTPGRQHGVVGVVDMEWLIVLNDAGVFGEGLRLVEAHVACLQEIFRNRDDRRVHREQVQRLVGMGKLLQADELQRTEATFGAGIGGCVGAVAKRGDARVAAGVELLRRRIELEQALVGCIDLGRVDQPLDQDPAVTREMIDVVGAVSHA
jgi:hypothetical protein